LKPTWCVTPISGKVDDLCLAGTPGARIGILAKHELSLFTCHLLLVPMPSSMTTPSSEEGLMGLARYVRFADQLIGEYGSLWALMRFAAFATQVNHLFRRKRLVTVSPASEIREIGRCTRSVQDIL
jgi:hypothetical protein